MLHCGVSVHGVRLRPGSLTRPSHRAGDPSDSPDNQHGQSTRRSEDRRQSEGDVRVHLAPRVSQGWDEIAVQRGQDQGTLSRQMGFFGDAELMRSVVSQGLGVITKLL